MVELWKSKSRLKGALLSLLSFETFVLTLYVKEKVGADEGEYHHGDRQGTVRHNLSDSGVQIRAVGEKKRYIFGFCNSDVIYSTSSFTTLFTVVTLLF